MTAADTLREVLRADLKAAIKAGWREEANLVRTLIAAIDNAEAVPLPDGARPADSASFASGAAEAPRKVLDEADVRAVLNAEIDSRLNAATQIRAMGNEAEAFRLDAEADMIGRYLA